MSVFCELVDQNHLHLKDKGHAFKEEVKTQVPALG